MRKWIVILVALLLVVVGSYIFATKYTLSAILKNYDFTKEDILLKESYNDEVFNTTKYLFLLNNAKETAMIIAEKGKFGFWKVNDYQLERENHEVAQELGTEVSDYMILATMQIYI